MKKIWKLKDREQQDLVQHLLFCRGILNEEDKENFLNTQYEKLNNPFLFKDMEKTVERLWRVIENKETILIYSDYDADAVTANAVLYRTFQALGVTPLVYIPDRFSEGYGLNVEAFEKIKEMGAKVVITVDCGTNSTAEAEFCKKNGIDLIITDHHEITGELPDAYALVNPKNPNDAYPYRELTGVGVAFKVATALLSKKEKHPLAEGYEKWLLDLVAIGTVADCHSLMGENRILVKYGLKVLGKTKWPGLREMMIISGTFETLKDRQQDTYALGYVIAPRINAAGRIEHASSALKVLITDEPSEARKAAEELDVLNKRRQMLSDNVVSEAREQLLQLGDRKILMATGKDWPKGVVGLVAGKLAEEFGRPVLIMERGEEFSTGSARSAGSFNLVEALNATKDILVRYGGHAAAAGFTVKTKDLEQFYKNLSEYAEQRITEKDQERVLEIDAELQAQDITFQTLELLELFEPFGVDNFKPIFMIRNAKIQDMRAVGKDGSHLQMTLALGSKLVKTIGFGMGKWTTQILPGENIDVVFELISDVWKGNKNLKLRTLDLRKAEF